MTFHYNPGDLFLSKNKNVYLLLERIEIGSNYWWKCFKTGESNKPIRYILEDDLIDKADFQYSEVYV